MYEGRGVLRQGQSNLQNRTRQARPKFADRALSEGHVTLDQMYSLPPGVLPCQRALCSALPGGDLVGAHTGIWRCAHRLECLRWILRAPLWCSVFYLFKNRFAEMNTGTGAPMNDTGAPMNDCAHFASNCQLVHGLRPSASKSLSPSAFVPFTCCLERHSPLEISPVGEY